MGYPVKFREKVMEYLKRGNTQKNTVQTFGISTDTLWDWRNGNGKKARRNTRKQAVEQEMEENRPRRICEK